MDVPGQERGSHSFLVNGFVHDLVSALLLKGGVEVNSALSGGTGKQTMAQAFKAVLYSDLGHSGPEIGAQAAAYAH